MTLVASREVFILFPQLSQRVPYRRFQCIPITCCDTASYNLQCFVVSAMYAERLYALLRRFSFSVTVNVLS